MRSFIFLLALCGIVISCDAKDIDDNSGTIDIDIEVLTKEYTAEYTFDKRNEISINKDLPTVIFIHGLTGVSDLAELLKDAYFKHGPNLPPAEINLMKINWRDGASYYTYAGSAERVKEVGNYLASFINELLDAGKVSMDKLSLVGHSLGAHCAGFAARKLEEVLKKKGAKDTMIPVIIGLDPARPGFEIKSPGILTAPIQLDGLSESDAEKVLIVHTNPGGFGYLEDAGTVDVYFRYENKHPSECTPKHTGAKALKYLFRGDIKKAFLTIKDLIKQLGSKLPERIINYFKFTESKGAYLCDHVFANIYFQDAITEGGRKTDLFTLFKEYSLSIPNAIVNEGKDRCQPDIDKGEKLSWKKECTNAKRIKSDKYREKV